MFKPQYNQQKISLNWAIKLKLTQAGFKLVNAQFISAYNFTVHCLNQPY